MKQEEKLDILEEALRTYGAEAQTIMVMEEMAELQKALCKLPRTISAKERGITVLQIAEEIADVQIMLEQMIILHDIAEPVDDYKTLKLIRLKNRLWEATKEGEA